jgi:hypothetical protein
MSEGRRNYRFPKDDEIRFIELELRCAELGQVGHWPLRERPVDLQVWLARSRDGKSWQAIGDEFFPTVKDEARRSEARRAYARVERVRDDVDGRETLLHNLRAQIEEVFGVTAEDFRNFIKTGRLTRPREAPRKATKGVK